MRTWQWIGAQRRPWLAPFIGFHSIGVEIPAAAFGLLWIGFQLWDASNDPQGMEGIAWYAHIGGFFAGAITMWLAGSFMEQKLVDGKNGQPIFVQKKTTPIEQIEETAAVAETQPEPEDPTKCPYCQSDLAHASSLGAGLARCGNPACERLIYSTAHADC